MLFHKTGITKNFHDFEDAVQYVCGLTHRVDAIVTRDTSGFINSEIPIVSPGEIDILLY